MIRFLLSIFLIPLGLAVGLILQRIFDHSASPAVHSEKTRKGLQIVTLLFLNPVAFAGAVWILPLQNLEVIFLPFLGVAAISLGGIYSLLYTARLSLPRPTRGSHFCVGYYTNIGSIGGLIIYALLGEPGFTLLPFYKLLEPVMYFAVGFPVASRFGKEEMQDKRSILEILKDPFVMVSMGGILIGLILNITGVPRPSFYGRMNSILVPLASFLLLISIGIAMRFKNMKAHVSSTLSILVIKFILVPVTVTGAAYALGLGKIMGGLPLQTVFVLSSMPAGFMAIMPASLYDLDLDYANTAWLATMIGLLPLVPWLYFCLKYVIPRLM